MEVDDAAGLVLGHLDEPDADLAEQGLLGDPGEAGQVPGQVGDEPAPQVARVGVEQHGRWCSRSSRGHIGWPSRGSASTCRVGQEMSRPCGQRRALGVAAGAAGQHGLAAHPAGVDRAERRRGEGGEHARVRGDRLGDALAAGQARRGRAGGRRACRPASRPGRRSRGGCRRRRAALRRVRRRCRRRGRVSPVARSMASMRPRSRIGWEQVVSWSSQVRKSAQEMVSVVGGRPGSRARDGIGTQSGCRGSISRHSHHLSGSW